MKKDFQEHIDIVLQEAISILQSTKNIVEQQLDLPDETTIPFWKDAYYSLVLLEKILCHFPDILLDTRLEVTIVFLLRRYFKNSFVLNVRFCRMLIVQWKCGMEARSYDSN